MNKSYIIKEIYSGMRIDRWIRNNITPLPQSLIEKSLRKGKIKVNIKDSKKLPFPYCSPMFLDKNTKT